MVEDDDDSRQSLGELLQVWGHEPVLAESGFQALEAADRKAPSIALVDIGLPDVDGYELARRLKSLESPPTHMVALTGYDSHEDLERSRDAGFDHHLVKPVDLRKLRSLLDELPTRSG